MTPWCRPRRSSSSRPRRSSWSIARSSSSAARSPPTGPDRALRARRPGCPAAGRVCGRRGGRAAPAAAAPARADGRSRLPDAVVAATEPSAQAGIWDVRKAGLNIVMSMKGAGKPVSFIEDCAVPLEHLADYTARLTELFARHGTSGTWYAHASVGCLHVRPILNLKQDQDVAMRAIAEEAFALVRATRAPIPASMATAWCAPSSTRRCSATGWCVRSRSSSARRPAGRAQPQQDRPCAAWTSAGCSAIRRAIAPRRSRRRWTGRPGAGSSAPPRCATTTAPAARPSPA